MQALEDIEEQEQVRWDFWVRWVLASTVGVAVGGAALAFESHVVLAAAVYGSITGGAMVCPLIITIAPS